MRRNNNHDPPEACPDSTLAELQERTGIVAGLSTIHSMLGRLGLRRKKSLRAAEQERPDVAAERRR